MKWLFVSLIIAWSVFSGSALAAWEPYFGVEMRSVNPAINEIIDDANSLLAISAAMAGGTVEFQRMSTIESAPVFTVGLRHHGPTNSIGFAYRWITANPRDLYLSSNVKEYSGMTCDSLYCYWEFDETETETTIGLDLIAAGPLVSVAWPFHLRKLDAGFELSVAPMNLTIRVPVTSRTTESIRTETHDRSTDELVGVSSIPAATTNTREESIYTAQAPEIGASLEVGYRLADSVSVSGRLGYVLADFGVPETSDGLSIDPLLGGDLSANLSGFQIGGAVVLEF
ncbi:MAG TPA: hypothetical protein VF234_03150 [Limnochordia bacterium]